jgi:hypothetical protein
MAAMTANVVTHRRKSAARESGKIGETRILDAFVSR